MANNVWDYNKSYEENYNEGVGCNDVDFIASD